MDDEGNFCVFIFFLGSAKFKDMSLSLPKLRSTQVSLSISSRTNCPSIPHCTLFCKEFYVSHISLQNLHCLGL